jgi:hypothetical protein
MKYFSPYKTQMYIYEKFTKSIPALQTNSGDFPAPRELTADAPAPTLSRPETSAGRSPRKFFCGAPTKRTRLVHSSGHA